MKYKTVSLGLKRDLRMERFNVSQISVQLTAEVEPGEDLEKVYDEVYEDAVIIIEEMAVKERLKFKEEKSALTHK